MYPQTDEVSSSDISTMWLQPYSSISTMNAWEMPFHDPPVRIIVSNFSGSSSWLSPHISGKSARFQYDKMYPEILHTAHHKVIWDILIIQYAICSDSARITSCTVIGGEIFNLETGLSSENQWTDVSNNIQFVRKYCQLIYARVEYISVRIRHSNKSGKNPKSSLPLEACRPHLIHPCLDTTHHPKRHPDPISRFMPQYTFPYRHTDRQTNT